MVYDNMKYSSLSFNRKTVMMDGYSFMVSSEDPVNKWSVSSFQFHKGFLWNKRRKIERVIRIYRGNNENSGKSTKINI